MTEPRAFGLEWSEAEIDPGWQGILALRFADPPGGGAAAELIVTLAKGAVGLLPADLHLQAPEGGPLACVVLPVPDGQTFLQVLFADRGPRGLSTARLLRGGGDPLHPFFAEATFDFFIDCPAGDCRAAPEADAPLPGAEPAIDLATKDYAGFLQVIQDWALATDPGWGDMSPASTEGMLAELLAHHAEMLSLYQDRVAQEAFIDTARERLSLRRHAAFLGLSLDEGDTATALIAVDAGPGLSGYLPAGTRIIRREDGGRVTATFLTAATTLIDSVWNAGLSGPADRGLLRPAAWPGAPDAALPPGTREMLLLDWDLGLLPGQTLALIQGRAAHAATLIAVDEILAPGWADDPGQPPALTPRRVTRLQWDRPTGARFAPWADPVAQPFLITANLVLARHGDPRAASNATEADLRLGASRQDLVAGTDLATGRVLIRALRTPEPDVLFENGRPALSLTLGQEVWDWQPDLRTSAGFDRHFTTEREEDGSVWILFGDGTRGRAVDLPAGSGPDGLGSGGGSPASMIEVTWKRGQGDEGNLGAFALNAALPPYGGDAGAEVDFAALSLRAATNILPATGGRGAVATEVARQLIPESIRHPALERCVTADDYARAAEEVPGVAQAAAKPLGGLFNTLAVLCAPDEGDQLDPSVADAVRSHLDARRMAGREHLVRPPDYVPLDISLLICPTGNAGAAAIRTAVRTALAPGTAARPGAFHRSRLGFGTEVRLADILAMVARAPGVGAVKALTFRPLFEAGGSAVRRAIALGPTQIAQFAADEAHPERGRLTIRIVGADAVSAADGFVVAAPAPEEVTP